MYHIYGILYHICGSKFPHICGILYHICGILYHVNSPEIPILLMIGFFLIMKMIFNFLMNTNTYIKCLLLLYLYLCQFIVCVTILYQNRRKMEKYKLYFLLLFLTSNAVAYNPEEELLFESFPNNFVWGTATAAYQV